MIEGDLVKDLYETTSLKIQDSSGKVRVLSKKEEKEFNKSAQRLVTKDGERKVKTVTGFRTKQKRFRDIFTSVVDYSWSSLLLLISVIYVGSWVTFALLWKLLIYLHINFGPQSGECLIGVTDFSSSLLFSMELQQTIEIGRAHV